MNGKTKSILLQVAFKEAVTSVNQQGIYSMPEVRERTTEFYKMLGGLHEELGIDAEDTGKRSGGSGGGNRAPSRQLPDSVTIFTAGGESWYDFRRAKDNGEVKAGHPEFKTLDNKTSLWMYDREGNPNPDAAKLVTAADTEVL